MHRSREFNIEFWKRKIAETEEDLRHLSNSALSPELKEDSRKRLEEILKSAKEGLKLFKKA